MSKASVPTLHEAVRAYGQWRVGPGAYSLNTWAGEAPGLHAFADHMALAGIDTVDALHSEAVSVWWQAVRVGMSAATAPTRLHQLRSFLAWAIRMNWLDEDPTVFIRAPRPAPEPRQRLTARELLDMIELAPYPQHRIILALCANLALRASEIQTLTVGDVNLDSLSLRVRIHKTREMPDEMPLTEELAAELNRWLDHYANHPHRGPITGVARLVPSQHVAPATSTVTYRVDRSIGDPEDVVKRALTTLGWATVKGEGIHTVRRSMARIFFDAVLEEEGDGKFDEALLGTMRLLHHTRPETTLRYIGMDRQTMARDKFLRGRPFLTRWAEAPALRAVQ